MEDWRVASVLPNEHLLRDERVELVPSLDDSHLLFDHTHIEVHTSVVPTIGLRDVDSQSVLHEVVEEVVAQLGSLALLVEYEFEVVREDVVRGQVLCPHIHVSHSDVLQPPRLLPSVGSMLETRWAY